MPNQTDSPTSATVTVLEGSAPLCRKHDGFTCHRRASVDGVHVTVFQRWNYDVVETIVRLGNTDYALKPRAHYNVAMELRSQSTRRLPPVDCTITNGTSRSGTRDAIIIRLSSRLRPDEWMALRVFLDDVVEPEVDSSPGRRARHHQQAERERSVRSRRNPPGDTYAC